jgi:hypothetical protein
MNFILDQNKRPKIFFGGNQTPNKIIEMDGLSFWYDGQDISTITFNGNDVAVWADKSGNGYDIAQGTAANQPTYDYANKYLTFNGTSDYLFSNDSNLTNILSINNSHTVFVVSLYDSGGSPSAIETIVRSGVSSANLYGILYDVASSVQGAFVSNGSLIKYGRNGIASADTINLQVAGYNGSAFTYYAQDGIEYSYAAGPSDSGNSGFHVCRRSDAASYNKGAIGEIIGYNRLLADEEIDTITDILKNKWSIT